MRTGAAAGGGTGGEILAAIPNHAAFPVLRGRGASGAWGRRRVSFPYRRLDARPPPGSGEPCPPFEVLQESSSIVLPSVLRALLVVALQGFQIPTPRPSLLNDFAGVVSPADSARIVSIAEDVRDKSQGIIAVVTLPDIGGREASEVALRILREWKVGQAARIGDRVRNTGTVILIVPKETSSDNRGQCRIETGQGAEGFIIDAEAGEICREAIPLFQQRDYSGGLSLITYRVAQQYAQEFGFALDTALRAPAAAAPRPVPPTGGGGINPLLLFAFFVILMVVLSNRGGRRGRRRGGIVPVFFPPFGGGGGGWGAAAGAGAGDSAVGAAGSAASVGAVEEAAAAAARTGRLSRYSWGE